MSGGSIDLLNIWLWTGERNRVQLAKVLKHGANLILLDEPTNDLDIEVLSNLENALQEFAGCQKNGHKIDN